MLKQEDLEQIIPRSLIWKKPDIPNIHNKFRLLGPRHDSENGFLLMIKKILLINFTKSKKKNYAHHTSIGSFRSVDIKDISDYYISLNLI